MIVENRPVCERRDKRAGGREVSADGSTLWVPSAGAA